MGVIIHTGNKQALVRSPAAPQGQWYVESAEFDGWTLTGIAAGGIILQSGGTRKELKLYADGPEKPRQ